MNLKERDSVYATIRGMYTNYKSLSEKIDKFVTSTYHIAEEIEKLMQVAMIEEARDSRHYSPWQALDLLQGCTLHIVRGDPFAPSFYAPIPSLEIERCN